MPNNKTITINGRVYDAVTGLPVSTKKVYDAVNNRRPATAAAAAPKPAQKPVAKPVAEAPKKKSSPATERTAASTATSVHSQTQRSQTLLRRASKKPVSKPVSKRPGTGRNMDIARSSKISKFAPHPVAKAPVPKPVVKPITAAKPDKAPQIHPVAAKAVARAAAAKPVPVVAKAATSKEVKDAAIATALAAPKPKTTKKSKKQRNKWLRRFIIVGSIALAVGLILFAVYRFVPSVSVGIASAQAGVKASYPEYVPDGYSLNHPVTYSDGEVALEFKSNSNENSYTITQTRSSWDSSAVLDNVVRPAAGENYTTTKERGLTIYQYDSNAAWVNGGVLYVISSNDAPLSGEQIRHIATSL